MTGNEIIFEQKGYPTIKLLDDRISIKSIDFSGFRDFKFDKIKELKFYRPFDNSILGFLFLLNPFIKKFRETDDYILRVKLVDGEHWDYKTTYNYNQSFIDFINLIKEKIGKKY